jgi:hypothetical protein
MRQKLLALAEPNVAKAAPLLPLVKIPTFALVPLPSFSASAPATGAVAVLDFYLRLQVSDKADFASIHRSFLRKVRPILREFAFRQFGRSGEKRLIE